MLSDTASPVSSPASSGGTRTLDRDSVITQDSLGYEDWLRQRGDDYRNMTCPRQHEDVVVPGQDGKPSTTVTVYKLFPLWAFSAHDFAQFGVGVHMWFHFLKVLCLAFFCFSVLVAPTIMYNIAGDQAYSFGLHTTTLGNLGSAADITDVEMPPLNRVISKKVMRRYMAFSDAAICALFLLVIIKLQRCQKAAQEESERQQVSVAQYAVQVSMLPKNTHAEEVKEFFKRYGEVADCIVAYDDADFLETYATRGRLKQQIQAAAATHTNEKELKQLRKQLESMDKRIAKDHAKRRASDFHRNAVCAFVTFETTDSVAAVLADYPNGAWARFRMSTSLRLRGAALRVLRSPEPSTIRFQNLQYTKLNKALRRGTCAHTG